jgi:ribonuclease HI
MDLPDNLVLRFTGICEPRNPGGVAVAAWILSTLDDVQLARDARVVADGGEKATNNYAAYCGLGLGLRYLLDQGWKGSLGIRSSSKVVTDQVLGTAQCRADLLIPLKTRCLEYLQTFSNWSIGWVNKSQTEAVNRFAHRAYDEYRRKKR